jgi:3-isopropylmalate dehydrogenase
MLLRHSLGLETEAAALEKAVERALAAGARTADLRAESALSTRGMTEAVIAAIEAR